MQVRIITSYPYFVGCCRCGTALGLVSTAVARAVAVSSLSLVVSNGLPAPSDRESWYNCRVAWDRGTTA